MSIYIEKVYADFREHYIDNPDYSIDFFEEHFQDLNNILAFQNKQGLKFYIEIAGIYVGKVYEKARFNVAIDIVDKQQQFIDSEIERLHAEELKDDWYHSLHFVKGMASYELKDYKTAVSIFKKLVAFDPQNDSFRIWLKYAQYGQRIWIIRTVNIVTTSLLIVSFIFESQIPNYYLRQTILMSGLILLMASSAYEYYIKRNQRKPKVK